MTTNPKYITSCGQHHKHKISG